MDDFAIENRETIFLGDSISDWHASKACKVDFALMMTGNGKKTLEELNLTGLNGIKCHLNLAQYADSLNF
jgi:phosphoglycolate phosphatase-like HAD superfamily hydrolase